MLPSIIVCTETWNLVSPQYYNLNNYTLYYNNSTLNRVDSSVFFIHKSIKHETIIDEINNIKFLSVILKLNGKVFQNNN